MTWQDNTVHVSPVHNPFCHAMPCILPININIIYIMHATAFFHLLLLLLSANFYFFPRSRVLRIQYLCLCCPFSPHIRKHYCFPSSIVKPVLVYMAITWGQKPTNIISVSLSLSLSLSACIYVCSSLHAWLDYSLSLCLLHPYKTNLLPSLYIL